MLIDYANWSWAVWCSTSMFYIRFSTWAENLVELDTLGKRGVPLVWARAEQILDRLDLTHSIDLYDLYNSYIDLSDHCTVLCFCINDLRPWAGLQGLEGKASTWATLEFKWASSSLKAMSPQISNSDVGLRRQCRYVQIPLIGAFYFQAIGLQVAEHKNADQENLFPPKASIG